MGAGLARAGFEEAAPHWAVGCGRGLAQGWVGRSRELVAASGLTGLRRPSLRRPGEAGRPVADPGSRISRAGPESGPALPQTGV